MTPKFISAPTMISKLEANFADYGFPIQFAELGLAVIAGVVLMGIARTFHNAA